LEGIALITLVNAGDLDRWANSRRARGEGSSSGPGAVAVPNTLGWSNSRSCGHMRIVRRLGLVFSPRQVCAAPSARPFAPARAVSPAWRRGCGSIDRQLLELLHSRMSGGPFSLCRAAPAARQSRRVILQVDAGGLGAPQPYRTASSAASRAPAGETSRALTSNSARNSPAARARPRGNVDPRTPCRSAARWKSSGGHQSEPPRLFQHAAQRSEHLIRRRGRVALCEQRAHRGCVLVPHAGPRQRQMITRAMRQHAGDGVERSAHRRPGSGGESREIHDRGMLVCTLRHGGGRYQPGVERKKADDVLQRIVPPSIRGCTSILFIMEGPSACPVSRRAKSALSGTCVPPV
jgi:hypothetical protein